MQHKAGWVDGEWKGSGVPYLGVQRGMASLLRAPLRRGVTEEGNEPWGCGGRAFQTEGAVSVETLGMPGVCLACLRTRPVWL